MTPIYCNIRWNGNYESDFTEEQWSASNHYLLRHLELMKRHDLRASYMFTPTQTIYMEKNYYKVLKKIQESGMYIGHHGAPRPPEPTPLRPPPPLPDWLGFIISP